MGRRHGRARAVTSLTRACSVTWTGRTAAPTVCGSTSPTCARPSRTRRSPNRTSRSSALWTGWRPRRQPPSARICLGGSCIGNILFDEEGCVQALLDWDQASLAGPLADLGWWLLFDRLHGEDYGKPRLAASAAGLRRSSGGRSLPACARTISNGMRSRGPAARDRQVPRSQGTRTAGTVGARPGQPAELAVPDSPHRLDDRGVRGLSDAGRVRYAAGTGGAEYGLSHIHGRTPARKEC